METESVPDSVPILPLTPITPPYSKPQLLLPGSVSATLLETTAKLTVQALKPFFFYEKLCTAYSTDALDSPHRGLGKCTSQCERHGGLSSCQWTVSPGRVTLPAASNAKFPMKGWIIEVTGREMSQASWKSMVYLMWHCPKLLTATPETPDSTVLAIELHAWGGRFRRQC